MIRTVSCFLLVACSVSLFSQQNSASSAVVPTLVNFSGALTDVNGKPLTGIVGVTFYLYKDQEGGAPLWLETQNVQPDKTGHYSVMLGSTMSTGLPADLFASGEARWLGVQVQGQAEQPRVMLLSVPYALKAGDAATVGGLPPSAFVLAAPGGNNPSATGNSSAATASTSAPPLTTSNVTTTGGTASTIPMFTTATNIQNSILTQTGTTAINVLGKLNLPAAGTATASAGFNSRPEDHVASVFNSGTATPVAQTFRWQAEPVSNNTTSASGTLNLLYASGTATPAETGLKINSKGLLTFATGQKFPGTGTITGVTTASGSGLAGGATSGIANLSLTKTCATNQILQWNGTSWACSTAAAGTITGVTAGTDLTGGGTSGSVTLNVDTTKVVTGVTAGTDLTGGGAGGVLTLNLDTTKVPQLNTANTFTGNQTVNGNLSATGLVTGSAFNIGSNLFAFGSLANANAFLGFAGNSTMTGTFNTANGLSALGSNTTGLGNTAGGVNALLNNTTGSENTASGINALGSNTTGYQNTASGVDALVGNTVAFGNTASGFSALYYNTTGSNNTAVGTYAGNTTNMATTTGSLNTFVGFSANSGTQTNLTNSTAIGANAQVTASNALVLGSINGVNRATANANVGIGTTSPDAQLNLAGGSWDLTNTEGDFKIGNDTYRLKMGIALGGGGAGDSRVRAVGGTNRLMLGTGADDVLTISGTSVGIGTMAPDNLLTVNGSADKPGGGSWGTFSDRRLKTVNGNFTSGLDQILKLKPVRYRYKDDNALGIQDREEHVGFVAQEVQRVIPEAVTTNSKGYLLVNNDPILWAMLNAIKEQQGQIQRQQEQIRVQQVQIRAQRTQIKAQQTVSELQQSQIARLSSQVRTMQASLRASGPADLQVRTAKAEMVAVH